MLGENNLKAFKQKNIGMMPQQGSDYYSQLSQAVEDLNKTRLDLREAEQARDAIKRQITGDEPVLLVDQNDSISSIVNVELDSRIEALNKNLDRSGSTLPNCIPTLFDETSDCSARGT